MSEQPHETCSRADEYAAGGDPQSEDVRPLLNEMKRTSDNKDAMADVREGLGKVHVPVKPMAPNAITILKEYARERVAEQEAEIASLRKSLEAAEAERKKIVALHFIVSEERDAANARIRELEDGLMFYADPENHKWQQFPCRCGCRSSTGRGCNDVHPMQEDSGERARTVLKGTKE